MTFKETEYIDILQFIFEVVKRDDVDLKKFLTESEKFFKKSPLYPGIILMCMKNLINEIKFNEIKVGDFVVINTYKETISGDVKSIQNKKIVINEGRKENQIANYELNQDDIKKIIVLNKNVFSKLWPSLVFKEKYDND